MSRKMYFSRNPGVNVTISFERITLLLKGEGDFWKNFILCNDSIIVSLLLHVGKKKKKRQNMWGIHFYYIKRKLLYISIIYYNISKKLFLATGFCMAQPILNDSFYIIVCALVERWVSSNSTYKKREKMKDRSQNMY